MRRLSLTHDCDVWGQCHFPVTIRLFLHGHVVVAQGWQIAGTPRGEEVSPLHALMKLHIPAAFYFAHPDTVICDPPLKLPYVPADPFRCIPNRYPLRHRLLPSARVTACPVKL